MAIISNNIYLPEELHGKIRGENIGNE